MSSYPCNMYNIIHYDVYMLLGNVQLMAEVILYLNLPNAPDRKQRFKDTIYVTQVIYM